jgi:periplasmic divalent cation tolerance protein
VNRSTQVNETGSGGGMQTANGEMVVLTTLSNREQAHAFARGILDKRLAACVSVLGEATSFYRWESPEITVETEIPLLIKTHRDKLPHLEDYFKANHPYELPEFLILKADEISTAYAQWMKQEMKLSD